MVLNTRALKINYENGFLRYITYDEKEIIRMIYFALRNENWETLPFIIKNEKQNIGSDFFKIEYDCVHIKDGQEILSWSVKISGDANDTIVYEVDGKVLKDLKKNRAGICILHPIDGTVGEPAEVQHVDGSIEKRNFPLFVTPVNPFKNIRKLKWQFNAQEFEIEVEGDVFETEDQRNWTDASFKTFCTPSYLPIPVQLKSGDQISQKVIFKPVDILAKKSTSGQKAIKLTRTEKRRRLPSIGIGASTEILTLDATSVKLIKQLSLDHYRIEITPSHPHWVTEFSNEYQQAFEMNLPLEVALHLTEDYKHEMDAFVTLCLQNRVRLRQVILFDENSPVTSQEIIHHSFEMKKLLPKVLIGAGTDFNFYELNTLRLNNKGLAFINYSATPQIHAFDDQTIIENIEGQFQTAITATSIFPGQPIHISPITLKKRINPAASNASDRVMSNEQKADPRQSTILTALFAFGSVRALAEAMVSSVTYFQTSGTQGILSENAQPYPVYKIFEIVRDMKGKELTILDNPNPLLIDVLCFDEGSNTTLWLANYSTENQNVNFEDRTISLQPREIKKEILNRS